MNSLTDDDSKTSEINYRRLFESARDGILILDAARKIIDANQSAAALTGFPHSELPGKSLWEVGIFPDEDECLKAFQKLETGACVFISRLELKTRNGTTRETELLAGAYEEGTRRFIQCNIRDAAARQLAEKENERQSQEAMLLAQIAGKAAKLGGWSIELPERRLIWSDENCAIHEVPPGYTPTLEEGIGLFPEEYREKVIRYVEECASEGTPYDFELPKYTAKGRLIWVRSIGEAVRDENGKIIRLQGAFQDITAQKQAEAEREKLIRQLQDALAEVKTLREFLPICSYCKKVRADENYWSQIESYISEHTHTKFSHSICPDCYETEVAPNLKRMKQKPISDV